MEEYSRLAYCPCCNNQTKFTQVIETGKPLAWECSNCGNQVEDKDIDKTELDWLDSTEDEEEEDFSEDSDTEESYESDAWEEDEDSQDDDNIWKDDV